jgi:hypothetical protein
MLEHPAHLQKKRTMIKDRVGCVRTSTYSLPNSNHVYGLERSKDSEGAGDLISNWVTANPSEMKKTRNLTVYQNVLAVKHGAITAKSMRQFAADHPSIRLKESLHENDGRVDASHEGPFGVRTK